MRMARVMFVTSCLLVAFLCCCNPSCASRIIQPTLAKSTVVEGGSLKLVCMSNDTMIWKAHGVQVKLDTGRIKETVENLTVGAELYRSTLVISNLNAADSATYECKEMSDILGLDMAQIEIKVIKAAKLTVTVENIVNNVTRSQAVGRREKVSAGGDLNLHCTGEARSNPSWKFEGVLLKESPNVVITSKVNRDDNSKMSMLSRHNVTKAVAGRYQCVDTASYQSDSNELTVYISSVAKSAASAIVLALCAVLVAVSSSLFQ